MIPFIDLKKQYSRIEKDVDQAIKKVLMHGQYILGPEVAELEKKLADFAGTEYCLGCSSGTDALLMAMMALDFKKGDAVFTTPFTFFATVEMIALTGATPVFADIDPKTYNINPARLREAILKVKAEGKLNLKAIVTVDIFGQPADYDEIQKIADEFGMPVIEDGAQAMGALYKGRRVPPSARSDAPVSSPQNRSVATVTAARYSPTTRNFTTKCSRFLSTAEAAINTTISVSV